VNAPEIEPATMPANPKQFYGDNKIPLGIVPTTAVAGIALALVDGMLKYGADNYMAVPVEAKTYSDAAKRHISKWARGQDFDPESELDELFHAGACIAILIGAKYGGNLIDNRRFPDGFPAFEKQWAPMMQKLREKHAGKNPRHYTIADAPEHKDSTGSMPAPR
jgi:hypothetical protein